MTVFEVKYIDDAGDKQDYEVTATDVRTAINNALELCPDARRIVRCYPKPMFND